LIEGTGEIMNKKMGRKELIELLAPSSAGRLALKACGSAHWSARKIAALGHQVALVSREFG
jgi:transposase